jgi:uncharacterized damage-inducible protein DinB
MIDTVYLASAYDRNVRIIKMQTEGLTHEESMIQLPFRANCMNWIVGHLVTNRNNILKLLDAEDHIDPISVDRYIRDSDPITADSTDALPLEQLIQLLEHTQENMASSLEAITNDELERNVAFFGNTEMTVGEWLIFFFFHDSYHAGQAEILRQAAGKDDKVI